MSKFQGVLKMFMLGMLKTILKTVLKYKKTTSHFTACVEIERQISFFSFSFARVSERRHIWIHSSKKFNVECGFHFLSQSSNITISIKLNDSVQHIISHAFTKYEVWKILSYYNVNLTIINLTYTGFNDSLCKFAGITVHSLNKDLYKEITTECMSFINILPSRDTYSKSNETLLVLYSYKEYGNLSSTIQFFLPQSANL